MARVLITGGAGFIGCRLAGALVASGYDVVAVDNLHPQVHATRRRPAALDAAVELIEADVAGGAETWDDVVTRSAPDTVVHLAAETGTGQSLTEPTRHAAVNVVGAAALVEALERNATPVQHVVLASSRAVYGDGAWQDERGITFYPGGRTPEMLAAGQWDHRSPDGAPAHPLPAIAGVTMPDPSNVYAATKLAQEHVLSAWCAARAVPLSVLRLQNVYGAGQSISNPYTGVLTSFARTALAGGTLDVFEDGRIVRDFVHVADVVDALLAVIARPQRRLLDIGSGVSTTIEQVARLIAERAGAPAPVISGNYRLGDVRAAGCDIAAATAELGAHPQWDLDSGITELLAWVAAEQSSEQQPSVATGSASR